VDCSAKIDVIKGMQDTLGLERPGLRELKATVDGHNVLLCKEYEANEIEKIARYHGARASVEQLTTDF
jgi:ribosomal protein L7/L12